MTAPATPSSLSRRAFFVGGGRQPWLAAVEALKAQDPLAKIVFLVPNAATAEALRDGLSAGRALLNVGFQTVEKAALQVVEQAEALGAGGPKLVLPAGSERLLMRRLLYETEAGKPFRELATSPGFLAGLASTLRDLIDGGVAGASLVAPEDGSRSLKRLMALAREYEVLRKGLALDDDSSRFQRATVALERGDVPPLADALIVVGIYDPTGLQEAFLTAALLHSQAALVFLPGHPFGAGFRERLARALEVEPKWLEAPRTESNNQVAQNDQVAPSGQLAPSSQLGQLEWLSRVWRDPDPSTQLERLGPAPAADGSFEVLSVPGGEVGAELVAREVAAWLESDTTRAPADVELVARGTGGVPSASLVRELVRLGVPVERRAGSLGETHAGRVLLALGNLLAAPRVARSRLMDLADDLPWSAAELAFGREGQPKRVVRRVDSKERALWDRLAREADLRVVIDEASSCADASRLLFRQARADQRDSARALVFWLEELANLHHWVRASPTIPKNPITPGHTWARLAGRLVGFLQDWMAPDAEGLGAWRLRLGSLARLDALGGSRASATLAPDGIGLTWVLEGIGREAFEGETLDPGGVRVSRLARRRGASARLVILLDADEGSFPRAKQGNVLLGEEDRLALAPRAPALAAALEREGEERALFGELCAIARERLVLVTTRVGIEARAASPSRLLLEAMGMLHGGEAPSSADVAEGDDDVLGLRRLDLEAAWRAPLGASLGSAAKAPSNTPANTSASKPSDTLFDLSPIAEASPPAGKGTNRVVKGQATAPAMAAGRREQLLWPVDRALLTALPAREVRAALAPLGLVAEASLTLETARQALPGRSAYDGQLGPEVLAQLSAAGGFRGTPEKGLSPSRLETFATCGMRAFLQSVLGLREFDLPEESRGIVAAERGKRVHKILESFGERAKAAGLEPWSAAPLEGLKRELFAAIDVEVEKARHASPEDQGSLWDAEAERYRGLLLSWLHTQRREPDGWVPLDFEWDFDGVRFEVRGAVEKDDHAPPLYLRGRADRIDARQLGGAGGGKEVRIVDYKTGKGADTKDDATGGGRNLQLALYGAAARAKLGAAASEGLFDFVFFGHRARWSGRGTLKSDNSKRPAETDDSARQEVRVLVEAMEAGVFWPTPRKDRKPETHACDYCPVAEACGPWRIDAQQSAAEQDPVLAGLRAVFEDAEDSDDSDNGGAE